MSPDYSVEGELLEDGGDPLPLPRTQLYSYLFYILDFQIRFLLVKIMLIENKTRKALRFFLVLKICYRYKSME